MKCISLFIVIAFALNGYSQTRNNDIDIVCSGYKSVSIIPTVILNGDVQIQLIRRNDLIEHGIQIVLDDQTFKIIGFKALYDCHSGVVPDIDEKTYIGNKINGEDNFIKGIIVGDHFVLDCINLEKNGRRYLVNGIMFEIL